MPRGSSINVVKRKLSDKAIPSINRARKKAGKIPLRETMTYAEYIEQDSLQKDRTNWMGSNDKKKQGH